MRSVRRSLYLFLLLPVICSTMTIPAQAKHRLSPEAKAAQKAGKARAKAVKKQSKQLQKQRKAQQVNR